jgi:hypothetical protein
MINSRSEKNPRRLLELTSDIPAGKPALCRLTFEADVIRVRRNQTRRRRGRLDRMADRFAEVSVISGEGLVPDHNEDSVVTKGSTWVGCEAASAALLGRQGWVASLNAQRLKWVGATSLEEDG